MNRWPLIELYVFAAFTIAGCAGLQDTSAPVQAAQAAADTIRNTAEFTLCQTITVGAWQRTYGLDPERAQGWRLVCKTTTPAIPSAPPQTTQ